MDMADPRSLIDTYSVYIDGQWVDPDRPSRAGGRYDDVCPATEAVIASAPDPSHAQVDSAIAAARNAFDSGPWADTGPEQRAGFLNQLGEALLAHADEFFSL
jgi:aldehyde dehydrogenase (NAD+)